MPLGRGVRQTLKARGQTDLPPEHRSVSLMGKYGKMANDFFHDLAAGFFPGAAAAALVIHGQARPSGGNPLTPGAVGGIWMILALGLVVSVGTGIFRLRYHSDHVKPELVQARNDTAFAKHIAFIITLVVAGIAFGMVAAA